MISPRTLSSHLASIFFYHFFYSNSCHSGTIAGCYILINFPILQSSLHLHIPHPTLPHILIHLLRLCIHIAAMSKIILNLSFKLKFPIHSSCQNLAPSSLPTFQPTQPLMLWLSSRIFLQRLSPWGLGLEILFWFLTLYILLF